MLTEIFKQVMLMSFYTNVIILLIFIMRIITKRVCSNAWHYYIWLPVMFSLIIPIRLSFSICPALVSDIPSFSTLIKQMDNVLAPIDQIDSIDTNGANESMVLQAVEDRGEDAAKPFIFELLDYLPAVWFAGVIIALLCKAALYSRFAFYLRKTSCDYPIGKTPNSLLSSFVDFRKAHVRSPFLIGLFRPVIYLPDVALDDNELEMVLTHEVIHVERKDLYYKFIMQLILCLHWFNPLVYLMNMDMHAYCELSCDEKSVARMDGEKRKRYMKTIILLMEKTHTAQKNMVAAMSASCGTERRIHEMINNRKRSIGARCFSIALAVVLYSASVVMASEVNNAANKVGYKEPKEQSWYAEDSFQDWDSNEFYDIFGDVESWNWSNDQKWYTADELKKEIFDEANLINKSYKDINSLSISVSTENIQIKRGGDKVKVSWYEWIKDEYQFTEENGKLSLQRKADNRLMKISGANDSVTSEWVNALVKQQKRSPDPENPKASTRTIRVTIPNNVRLDDLDLSASVGTISISGGNINQANIKTSVGKILVDENSKIDSLKARVSTGNVTIDGGEINNCEVKSSTGKVIVNDCVIDSLEAKTSTGKIYIDKGSINSIDISTSTGMSSVAADKFNTLSVKSSTGCADISLNDKAKNYKMKLAGNNLARMEVNGVKQENIRDTDISGADRSIYFSSSTGIMKVIDKK